MTFISDLGGETYSITTCSVLSVLALRSTMMTSRVSTAMVQAFNVGVPFMCRTTGSATSASRRTCPSQRCTKMQTPIRPGCAFPAT